MTPVPANSEPLPAGAIAVDAQGNLFVRTAGIFKVDTAGILTRVTGVSQGYSGDGGPALNAQLSTPEGLAVDGSGNLFIADTGNRVVREVAAATGIITTVAGVTPQDGHPVSFGDGGPATSAGFSNVGAVAVDGFGNLYIADEYLIRNVAAATGIITTVAGNGSTTYSGDGGPATAAGLGLVAQVAVDGAGNLYINTNISGGDFSAIRKVSAATGIITTVAGSNHSIGYSGDGGPATSAQIMAINLAVTGSGDIYIADYTDNVIRQVSAATGIIATVAGTGVAGDSGDGGLATSAELYQPGAVAVDGPGNLYIATDAIRKVTRTTGLISTVAGGAPDHPEGGNLATTQLTSPLGVALDGSGNLYISLSDVVWKVAAATGAVTTVAGGGPPGNYGDGGQATNATLNHPQKMAVDRSGNLYIADTFNNAIRKVAVATGIITTVAGTGAAGYSGDGGPASSASLSGPQGVALDSLGNLYIADTGNAAIRKVTGAGIISTVAGNGTAGYAGDGGPAVKAQVNGPSSVTVDGSGNLYFADTNNNLIRQVVAATGVINTVAGAFYLNGGYSGDGGPAIDARLYVPTAVAVDGSG